MTFATAKSTVFGKTPDIKRLTTQRDQIHLTLDVS